MIDAQWVGTEIAPEIASAPLFFNFGLGASLATFFAMYLIIRRTRIKCPWCSRRHPKRPENMTAEEYMRLYCGGWAARVKELEHQDRIDKQPVS